MLIAVYTDQVLSPMIFLFAIPVNFYLPISFLILKMSGVIFEGISQLVPEYVLELANLYNSVQWFLMSMLPVTVNSLMLRSDIQVYQVASVYQTDILGNHNV